MDFPDQSPGLQETAAGSLRKHCLGHSLALPGPLYIDTQEVTSRLIGGERAGIGEKESESEEKRKGKSRSWKRRRRKEESRKKESEKEEKSRKRKRSSLASSFFFSAGI